MSDNGSFREATAVTRRPDGSAYTVEIDPGWAIADKPNGGYLLAILARAAVLEVAHAGGAHPHPMAVSTHYLHAPAVAAEASVEVEVLRVGRTAAQVQATLRQADRACVTALLTLGTVSDAEPWWSDVETPALPDISDCILLPDRAPHGATIHLMRQVHERLDPATLGWGVGKPAGRGVLRGYAAFADGSDWDPLSLLVALDCFPPVTFDLGATGWVPTLELTCYLRGLPAPGPVVIEQVGGVVTDGRIDETCRVWDSRGRLVGSATQLAGLRVPDGPPVPRVG